MIVVRVHTADIQDRDGAPDVIADLLDKAQGVSKVFADGGYSGDKLRDQLKERGLPVILEIVRKSKETPGFTVIPRRWVVERTFAWMCRCRRLAKDFERSLESSLGAARCLSLPAAPGRARNRGLRHRNMMISDL